MDNGASSYRRFLDGDDEGIVEIIKDYKDGLTLYLNGYVDNIFVAEELMEETFFKIKKYMHFFDNSLQAIQKGVETLKSFGEERLTLIAPSGSAAATFALDNEINYIETPRTNHLQVIYKKDAVDKLEQWMKKYHIPKELFDIVYMVAAKELKAKKCTEFLKNWKAENL